MGKVKAWLTTMVRLRRGYIEKIFSIYSSILHGLLVGVVVWPYLTQRNQLKNVTSMHKSGCQICASLFEIISYYNNKVWKEPMKWNHPSFNFKVSFYTSITIWLLMSKVVKGHVKIKKSNKMWCKVQDKMQGDVPRNYLDTLVTLIILFSEMLKLSKIISSKSKKYCEGK